jgi:hypothetical protein
MLTIPLSWLTHSSSQQLTAALRDSLLRQFRVPVCFYRVTFGVVQRKVLTLCAALFCACPSVATQGLLYGVVWQFDNHSAVSVTVGLP